MNKDQLQSSINTFWDNHILSTLIDYIKIPNKSLAHREGELIAIPIAGDDQEALAVATQLVIDAGFDPVLVGGLDKDGWNLMPGDDDAPVIGENWDGNVLTKEDYDDLEYDINIQNFENLSNLLYEI